MNDRELRSGIPLFTTLVAFLAGHFTIWNGFPVRVGAVGLSGLTKSISRNISSRPSSRDNARGEELYRASCIVCHGPQASGGIGPRLVGNPILSNDQAFWKIVYEGRHMTPPLRGAVTEQQMADIRAWLQTLQ